MDIQKHIPSYDISIQTKDFISLRSDLWSSEPVPATFLLDGRRSDIEIMYRGAHIRKFPKKSYQCLFSDDQEIHLNAEYIDQSLMRNKLSLDFFSSIGALAPRSQHVLLTINGKFQGIYLQLESVNKHFLIDRGLPYGPIWYAENDDANFSLISPRKDKVKRAFHDGYSQKEGTSEDNQLLGDFIYKINTIPESDFENEIGDYLDVDKYFRWLAGVVCTQNFDGFIHNYALYRRSDSGLFEVIPWDYDATWGRDINGRIMEYDYIPVSGYNTLTARLLSNQTLRKKYKRILKEILRDQFSVDYLGPAVRSMYEGLRPYVSSDPYLQKSNERFDREPFDILEYVGKRRRYIIDHLTELD